jgi:hypothetical protein
VGPGGSPPGGSAGTPVPPDAGPDAPISCVQTHDGFSMKASLYWGAQVSCGAGTTDGVQELTGAVTSSGTNAFELDSCPPNADCMPMLSSFGFDAPGLYAYFPQGALVKVRLSVAQSFGCIQQAEVTNVPAWGGLKNPWSEQKLIYLSASDGIAEAIAGSDLSVFRQPLGCYSGPSCGGDPADAYVLLFGAIWQSSMGMPVYMGTTGYLPFKGPDGEQYLTVRNLRSFSSGYCDDYWNWAWWVAQGAVDL